MCNYKLEYHPCCCRISPPLSLSVPTELCPFYLVRRDTYIKNHTNFAARRFNSLHPRSSSSPPSLDAHIGSSSKTNQQTACFEFGDKTTNATIQRWLLNLPLPKSSDSPIAIPTQPWRTNQRQSTTTNSNDQVSEDIVKVKDWLTHHIPLASLPSRPSPPQPCPKISSNISTVLAPAHPRARCPFCRSIDPRQGRDEDQRAALRRLGGESLGFRAASWGERLWREWFDCVVEKYRSEEDYENEDTVGDADDRASEMEQRHTPATSPAHRQTRGRRQTQVPTDSDGDTIMRRGWAYQHLPHESPTWDAIRQRQTSQTRSEPATSSTDVITLRGWDYNLLPNDDPTWGADIQDEYHGQGQFPSQAGSQSNNQGHSQRQTLIRNTPSPPSQLNQSPGSRLRHRRTRTEVSTQLAAQSRPQRQARLQAPLRPIESTTASSNAASHAASNTNVDATRSTHQTATRSTTSIAPPNTAIDPTAASVATSGIATATSPFHLALSNHMAFFAAYFPVSDSGDATTAGELDARLLQSADDARSRGRGDRSDREGSHPNRGSRHPDRRSSRRSRPGDHAERHGDGGTRQTAPMAPQVHDQGMQVDDGTRYTNRGGSCTMHAAGRIGRGRLEVHHSDRHRALVAAAGRAATSSSRSTPGSGPSQETMIGPPLRQTGQDVQWIQPAVVHDERGAGGEAPTARPRGRTLRQPRQPPGLGAGLVLDTTLPSSSSEISGRGTARHQGRDTARDATRDAARYAGGGDEKDEDRGGRTPTAPRRSFRGAVQESGSPLDDDFEKGEGEEWWPPLVPVRAGDRGQDRDRTPPAGRRGRGAG